LSVLALCEYPNGLALSPDERTMYVANTRSSQYIHGIKLDAAGHMVGRSIFADMNEGTEPGIPDGLKVDSLGRVYCTGPGGAVAAECAAAAASKAICLYSAMRTSVTAIAREATAATNNT